MMDLTTVLLILLVLSVTISGVIWLARVFLRKRGRAVGYESIGIYLRAIPLTEAQKLDAIDLALKGAVVTLLGVIFFPLMIVGLVPLYYGSRKIALTLMGLGLTDSSST